MKIMWLLLFLLPASVLSLAQATSPAVESSCVNPRFSTKEDSFMFGRIAAAIEDLGGGYNSEARRRYASIVHDIEERSYHPCLRWMAYDGYGQSLMMAKKKDKAIVYLTRAVDLAKTLSAEERDESSRHLEEAQQLK